MKFWTKLLGGVAAALLVVTALRAQQPVVAVSITQIDVQDEDGGGVVGFTVTNGGSGYSSAPTVTVAPSGAGATAEAVANLTGVVSGIIISNGGGGYLTAPTVTISGGGGLGATATATLSGGVVTGIVVTNPGTGYSSIPTVTLSGGSGMGATATAAIGQVVESITITKVGSGYASPPLVTISGGGGSGAAAVALLGVSFTTPNESFGPAGVSIFIHARGVGTYVKESYSYEFYVNGTSIGKTSAPIPPSQAAVIQWTPPQPGSYFLTVKLTDGANTTSSLPVRYFATGTIVNSPVTNTLVPNGSSVVLKADATVGGGFIKQIQFYDNGVAIGDPDMTLPYSLIYRPAGGSGSVHLITAQAKDNNDATVPMSPAIKLNVITAIEPLPKVRIVSPLAAAKIPIGSSGTMVAVDASSASGRIGKVELYVDGTLLETNTAYPYTFSWTPTVAGNYKLAALAYDDKNNALASDVVSVDVVTPPTVSITSPTSGSTVAGGSALQVSVAATSNNGYPVEVQLFDDDKFVGSATIAAAGAAATITFSPTQKTADDGSAIPSVIYALASDPLGLSNKSVTISLNVTSGGSSTSPVKGIAPTVSLVSPVAGSVLAVNAAVALAASAADADGHITSVQFFVGGESVGTTTQYPYKASWTPTNLGAYTIVAKATDNDANVVSSTGIQITVIDPSSAAPVASITTPQAGASLKVGQAVTVVAAAGDDLAVASVQFFVDGQPLSAADTTFPFSALWTPSAPGSYTLAVRALDGVGNQSTLSTVVVTVLADAAPTVTLTSPGAGSTPAGLPVSLSATAADSDGAIASVAFYANGTQIGLLEKAPYVTTWTPTAVGTYKITARATDDAGNLSDFAASRTLTVTANQPPTVSLTKPSTSTVIEGNAVDLQAKAADVDGVVTSVAFYVGAMLVASDSAAPFAGTWTPTAKGTYKITARATDSFGNVSTSAAVTITVVPNQSPTVKLTGPTTTTSIVAGNTLSLTATADDADGDVVSVTFLAAGKVVGTATTAPYAVTWKPTTAGTYAVVARATDDTGNVTTSSPAVTVKVAANKAPTVKLTAPASGGTVKINTATTLTATAADTDGTVAKVQFYVNGVALGAADTAAPYTASWKPTAEGTYTLKAVATDDSGTSTTSAAVTVLGVLASSANADALYFGDYQIGSEKGRFAATNLHGFTATFIGYSTSGAVKTYYYTGIPVGSGGGFAKSDLSGTFSGSGASGTIKGGIFIGPVSSTATSLKLAPGYYAGNLTGRNASTFTAIVGRNGAIVAYAKDGGFVDAGAGTVGSSGSFSFKTRAGNTFAGKADPATGLLSGTIKGAISAAFTAGQPSTTNVADGFLRTVSARATMGTGANTLTVGFATAGTASKKLLLRAVGPSLAASVPSGTKVAADPTLKLYNKSGTLLATNANWLVADGTVMNAVGAAPAFLLGSKDAALVKTLAAGTYSAQVSGSGGGLVLADLYDADTLAPFAANRVIKFSAQAKVGTGASTLLGTFKINGSAPKRILVRGAGPALLKVNAKLAALADPFLRLRRISGTTATVIRENDNWSAGNDVSLVNKAAASVGATPGFSSGSKDALILITLPPGTYTAELLGVKSTSGIGLLEIYEVK